MKGGESMRLAKGNIGFGNNCNNKWVVDVHRPDKKSGCASQTVQAFSDYQNELGQYEFVIFLFALV